jgi:predicted lipase
MRLCHSIPVLTNANILRDPLDPSLFPGISSDITVHSGFADAHAGAAPAVLAAVKKAISTYGATTVVTVGHSLGAAISLLDAVYLPLNLPSSISFKSYLYGLPRVSHL